MNAILHRIVAALPWPGRLGRDDDGDNDLHALRTHPRRLLYVAGTLFSVLLLAALAVAVGLYVRGYQRARLEGFERAASALDAQLRRHDASYARLVTMTEYAWQHPVDDDPATRRADLHGYLRGEQCTVLQEGIRGTPQRVLGLGTERWPAARLQRYLGLARSMSIINPIAFSGSGAEGAGAAYFLDATGHLAVVNQTLAGSDMTSVLPATDREKVFEQLRAYANLAPPASPGDTVAALRADSGGTQARLGFAAHPVTGRPSLVSAFPARDGTRSLGVFVAFEPVDGLARVLREASDSNLLVVAPNGQVILGSRHPHGEPLVGSLHDAGLWVHGHGGVRTYRRGMRFFIASVVAGTDWSLVTTYDWRDLAAGGQRVLLLAGAVWALLTVGVWLVLRWIERRVLAPAALRAEHVYASEQLSRSLIQMTPTGLCLVDIGRCEPVVQNELARRYAGDAERAGLALYGALVDGYRDAAPAADDEVDVRRFELSHPGARRAPARHLLVGATRVSYEGRPVLLCALQDLTARVELQVQQERLREEAEAATRAQSRFLATMSHEIRTPLHGILGHLELFARSPLDEEQRARLRRITQSAHSLLSIISDVLDLERIEAGRLDIEATRLEPIVVMERVALLYAPLAQGKGVDLDLVVDPGLAPACLAPVARIEQVLRNLVSNAVKFTPSGRIEIRAMPGAGSGRLRMEVADSGIGLGELQQQRLFQPFMQADANVGDQYGGSGLGLSLCRQLCQLMGGDIEVRSTPGVGSVFAFEVQVQPCRRRVRPPLLPLAGRRVLLHSAVVSWRDEIARRLRTWGAEPVVLERLEQMEVDAALAVLPLVVFERNLPPVRPAALDACERVVRVRADGPLRAARRDGEWWASCYSGQALLHALLEGNGTQDASMHGTMATHAMIG